MRQVLPLEGVQEDDSSTGLSTWHQCKCVWERKDTPGSYVLARYVDDVLWERSKEVFCGLGLNHSESDRHLPLGDEHILALC